MWQPKFFRLLNGHRLHTLLEINVLPALTRGFLYAGIQAEGIREQNPKVNIWSQMVFRNFHNEELHGLYQSLNVIRPRGKESTEVRKSLSQPPGGTFRKLSSDAIFVVCSLTFILFRSKKTDEISRYSFRVPVLR